MKYCTHCGAEMHDEAVVCIKCGCAAQPVNTAANVSNNKNDVAVAAIIFAFLFPLLGFILGCVGLGKSGKLNGEGQGISVAAILISLINITLSLVLFFTVLHR